MTVVRRILVAEDDRPLRILFCAILTRGGYEVEAVGDGQQALEWLRREGADLVLLDLQMPEMDGFAALAAIRADPVLSCLPVLATSAYGHRGEPEVLAAGFDAYFQKPLVRQALLARIAQLLA